MDDQKQQIIEKLKSANNILVTVSRDPSVDQLAACIGLTLLLNKMKKHGTAVFSGKVPPIMKFLKPEETIEVNTDSLRDFIIAIDKAKADKLRYKVEDEVVKIFITPYKSSISEKDLIYSQGDFNVDVVVALGVHTQQDLDDAIIAHGRILHDAVVITVNTSPDGQIGSINWLVAAASGMSELVTGIATGLGEDLLDEQIATALLTGLVAETDHFGNAKTTPQVMTVGAALLAAGANQQLVAKELGHLTGDSLAVMPALAIDSKAETKTDDKDSKKDKSDTAADDTKADSIEDLLHLSDEDTPATPAPSSPVIELPEPKMPAIPEAPKAEASAKDSDVQDLINQSNSSETLTQLEESVHSPHLDEKADIELPSIEPAAVTESAPTEDAKGDDAKEVTEVDSARKAVEDALKGSSAEEVDPIQAMNALPVDINLGHDEAVAAEAQPSPAPGVPPMSQPAPGFAPPAPGVGIDPLATPLPPAAAPLPFNPAANEAAPLNMSPADQPFTMPLPPSSPLGGINIPPPQAVPPTSVGLPPQGPPPPPVPPPMPPAFGPSPK